MILIGRNWLNTTPTNLPNLLLQIFQPLDASAHNVIRSLAKNDLKFNIAQMGMQQK